MDMKKRVSIKDVAKAAGVSVATTSYALNHVKSSRISDSTASHVREVARRMGYVPNLSARTMIKRKSQLIGVIIPQTGTTNEMDYRNPFYAEILSGIERVTRENGYHIMVSGTGPNQDYSNIAQMRQLDAVIIIGTYPSKFLDDIRQTGIPVVLVDAYVEDDAFHQVRTNDRQGGYLATEHLLELGHRSIAFVSDAVRFPGVFEQRYLGYRDALKAWGLIPEDALRYECNVSYIDSLRLAERIVREGCKADAFFVAADVMALGLIHGFISSGVHVPEDYSVIGFDDMILASMSMPQISTVRQDITRKGEVAAQVAMDAIKSNEKQYICLPLTVVQRGSTGPKSSRKETGL